MSFDRRWHFIMNAVHGEVSERDCAHFIVDYFLFEFPSGLLLVVHVYQHFISLKKHTKCATSIRLDLTTWTQHCYPFWALAYEKCMQNTRRFTITIESARTGYRNIYTHTYRRVYEIRSVVKEEKQNYFLQSITSYRMVCVCFQYQRNLCWINHRVIVISQWNPDSEIIYALRVR